MYSFISFMKFKIRISWELEILKLPYSQWKKKIFISKSLFELCPIVGVDGHLLGEQRSNLLSTLFDVGGIIGQ